MKKAEVTVLLQLEGEIQLRDDCIDRGVNFTFVWAISPYLYFTVPHLREVIPASCNMIEN